MKVEQLGGLPGDPPYPIQIALPGASTFREGYVLSVHPSHGEAWIGNFQKGICYYSSFHALDDEHLVVVAGGQGYVVNVNSKACVHSFGGDVMLLLPVPQTSTVLAISNIDVELHCATLMVWRSKRIAWDGIGKVDFQSTELCGQARHFDDTWHPFRLQIATGEHTGGAYTDQHPSN